MKFQSSFIVSNVAAIFFLGSVVAYAADDKDDPVPPRPTFGTITDGTSNTVVPGEDIVALNNRTTNPRDHRSERVVQENETNFDEADGLFSKRTDVQPELETETPRTRTRQQGRPQTDDDTNEQEEIVAPNNRTRRVRDHRVEAEEAEENIAAPNN